MKRTVAISGANGFIGSYLAAEFRRRGWGVAGLIRRPSGNDARFDSVHEYSIESGFRADQDFNADAVIHCAFDMRGDARALDPSANIRAAANLRRCAGQFVFISSMSAHEGAYSRYGKSKFAVEQSLDPARTLTVRPGFVVGPGGGFRRLAQTIARSPILPAPYGGRLPIQTVWIGDLTHAVADLTEAGATGLFAAGERDSRTVESFYTQVATWLGGRTRLLPLPGAPVLWAARLCETIGLRLPITSDNVLGLRGLVHQPVEPLIEQLGWMPADLTQTLTRIAPAAVLGDLEPQC